MQNHRTPAAPAGVIAVLCNPVLDPLPIAEIPPLGPPEFPCATDAPPPLVAIDEDEDVDSEELPVEELPGALDPVDDFDEDDFDDEFDDDFEEELDEDEELDEEVTEADLTGDDEGPGTVEFDDE